MKVVIFAGGLGTRISEETYLKPKPMIEIGGFPIIWHIMKLYSHFGLNEFIICCGYKGYVIKEYFDNYLLHNSDVTFDLRSNEMTVIADRSETWKITLIDTGSTTMTGGRLKRVAKYLDDKEDFCLTYGDGLSDVNIAEVIRFHKMHNNLATLVSIFPPARFGSLEIVDDKVIAFKEKPQGQDAKINGGFFVLKRSVVDLIQGDTTIWEQEPLMKLAEDGQLFAFHHDGFWQPLDTLRDKNILEELWAQNAAPWKLWN